MQNQQSLTEDSNILSLKSTYSIRQSKTIFLQCAQPLADSLPVSSLFLSGAIYPFPCQPSSSSLIFLPLHFPSWHSPPPPPPPPPHIPPLLLSKLQIAAVPTARGAPQCH